MVRPRTQRLSREIIGRAALEMVDAGEELQLVPLAEKLGVSPSSLYHHVNGRDGVIRAIRHVLIRTYVTGQSPEVGTGSIARDAEADWKSVIRREVERTWRMYAKHPQAMQLLITVVIDDPDTLGFYERLTRTLLDAGLPDGEVLSTIEAIDAFSFGVALDALSPRTVWQAEGASDGLAVLLDSHPTGAQRNRAVFEHGLELLIDGISTRMRIPDDN